MTNSRMVFFCRGRGDIVPREFGVSHRKSHLKSMQNEQNAFERKLLLKKIVYIIHFPKKFENHVKGT
jgi:hypothetical protein